MWFCSVFVALLLTQAQTSGAEAEKGSPDCEYQHDIRTYFCKDITDIFPNKFYGHYHLKCVNCNIGAFTSATFPFSNTLLSFNASESGIRIVDAGAFSSLASVQYIYLEHNGIAKIAPGAFRGLKQIYELHLENNDLEGLFPGFLEQTQANSVDLSGNRIGEIPDGAFEGSLGILVLDLSHNHIKKIHADSLVDLRTVEFLDFSHNKLCNLPLGSFKNLINLRNLNLADNKLARFSIGAFSGLKSLNVLQLANNSLSNFDPTILLPIDHINKLDISGNGIFYIDADAVHLNAPSLRAIRLDDNLFSCTLLTRIVQFFKKVGIEVVNIVGRFHLQNVNGIACSNNEISHSGELSAFLEIVRHDTQMAGLYC